MEILFKQRSRENGGEETSLERLGARWCMVKYISYERDRSLITKKRHYHTGTEMHMIERGRQVYEVGGKTVEVGEGELLTVWPGTPHMITESDPDTVKYAICFNAIEGSVLAALQEAGATFSVEGIPPRVSESLKMMREERQRRGAYGALMIGNRALECILTVLRPEGIKDEPDAEDAWDEDERLTMAKQYIEDNIQRPLSVPEIAAYCHICEKQLTRIFKRYEGVGASEYIRDSRCKEIERLLTDTDMTLGEISEAMGFGNEYYFNTFFKRHSGMSPGAYRKTVQNAV